MMSAWCKGLKNAPQDRMIMVRHSSWECPAFVKWESYGDSDMGEWSGFVYVEELIANVAGGIELNGREEGEFEWAEVPV
jgi:hypothetical protein